MDQNQKKRIQNLKVIISEAIMVIAVIITVIVLAFVVSGYWLNSDFEVERQGLLQISSIPTGADVRIDGDSSWLQRTNTSKTLSSGQHSILLSKEGYDIWTKEINIREGLLYRLHYPRLFLNERETESVADVSGASFATVSPDRSTLLLMNSPTKWQTIPLEDDKIEPLSINVGTLFEGSQIISADWAKDNAHVLFEIKKSDTTEWILLDTDNPKNSINLSQQFATNFDDVQIVNNSASTLLALQGRNLRRIDVPSAQISAILAEKVISIDHFENDAVFVAEQSSNFEAKYQLHLLNINNGKTEKLMDLEAPVQVTISKFYDDKYIAILQDRIISLYQESDLSKLEDFTLSFSPAQIEVGHNGEFISMYDDARIATLDMEALAVVEWQADSSDFGWIDNDMIYAIQDGALIVYDFDGLNRRELAKNATSSFPATITNDKWLYYFSNGSLVREWLIKR